MQATFNERVVIRDFDLRDVPALCDYWFRSPAGFLESMGVEPANIRPEKEMVSVMQQKIAENRTNTTSKLAMLTVEVDGEPVGMFSLGDLVVGTSAVLHAHTWNPEFRGKGLGTYTYVKACRIFMDRFDLQEMLFKTPAINVAANRIKEKLGLSCVGQERVESPFMRPNLIANVYRLSRDKLEILES